MLAIARRHRVKLLGHPAGYAAVALDVPGARRPDDDLRRRATRPSGAGSRARSPRTRAASIDHWEILNEPDARWAFTGSAERLRAHAERRVRRDQGARARRAGGLRRRRAARREHDWIERVLATPGADAAHKFDIANRAPAAAAAQRCCPSSPQWLTGWRALLARHGFTRPDLGHRARLPRRPGLPVRPAPTSGGDRRAQAAFLRSLDPAARRGGRRPGVRDAARRRSTASSCSEGIVHVDEAQPSYPATRRPAFDDRARLTRRRWDPRSTLARASSRRNVRTAHVYERLAADSPGGGPAAGGGAPGRVRPRATRSSRSSSRSAAQVP